MRLFKPRALESTLLVLGVQCPVNRTNRATSENIFKKMNESTKDKMKMITNMMVMVGRQSDRQTDRQTDGQTDRQTGK